MLINPDLPPAAAKLAYEVRKQRRESRNRRLASACAADNGTTSTDADGVLVYGSSSSHTNSWQTAAADQVPTNAASIVVADQPPVGSVSNVNVSESLHQGIDVDVNTVSVRVTTAHTDSVAMDTCLTASTSASASTSTPFQ